MKKIAVFLFVACVLVGADKGDWLFPECQFRVPFEVEGGDMALYEKLVEYELDLNALLKQAGQEIGTSVKSFRLVEVDAQGGLLQKIEKIQVFASPASENSTVNLTFFMPDETPAESSRTFHLYCGEKEFGETHSSLQPLVSYENNVLHEGQESVQVTTPVATYYYHILGAGFASIEDKDGNDWLSYNPGVGAESQSGSGGMYRGLPNMGYPEGYCHPGKEVSQSRVIEWGPLKVSIYSESNDNKMQCVWDIFPTYARLTILKLRTPYWFLYEGTPGGLLEEESDFCVRLGNIKSLCSESWNGDINAQGERGEWLYFSDVGTNRSLFLVQHLDDEHADSYWPMNKEMTVFGFGRLDMVKSMVRQHNQFTVGLADTHDYDEMKKIIDSAYQPASVNIKGVEIRP